MAKLLDKTKDALGLHKEKNYSLAGTKIGNMGYGLMGFTWRENPQEFSKSIEVMHEALDLGARFWNGGEIYGPPDKNSLHLLRAYFDKYPKDADKVVISIKGGMVPGSHAIDGGRDNVHRSIDECLKQLGNKKLDLFECARVDPKTPIETTMLAAKEYIDAGKLGGVCLSECSANTIRRAAKIVKISGVEVEFSLWSTEAADNGVFKACAELDIPIIAYSPLGRGFLTGQVKGLDDLPADDFRRHVPRFYPENFGKNLELVNEIKKIADRKGCTSGQVALAWVRAQSERNGNPVIIPIPGTVTADRLRENMKEVPLGEQDVKEIDALLESFAPAGGRYDGPLANLEYGDSAPL